MGKVAIECSNSKEWRKVVVKSGKEWGGTSVNYSVTSSCINVDDTNLEYCRKAWYQEKGYTIISASEYLNEGGKDVSELTIQEAWNRGLIKEGQRVETCGSSSMEIELYVGCISNVNESSGKFTIARDDGSTGCGFDDGYQVFSSNVNVIRFLDNKTQTTKETNMKDNNINKNVQAVFSDKTGKELLLVDKHYDRDMMDRILMETHKVAILKACKSAEDELLKEEK